MSNTQRPIRHYVFSVISVQDDKGIKIADAIL